MAPNVALVFGSFFMGDCERDIQTIKNTFPKIAGLEVAEPVEGNAFDFNSLKECKAIIICTSSQIGFPPPNFKEFAWQLLAAATSNPGCLSHLKHAVYGNGDETYFKTYMNVPRYVDLLLEKCGSQRFYARGETGEPHAPMDTEKCEMTKWAPCMWTALAASIERKSEPVAWDAHWAKTRSETHEKVTEWDIKQLEKKLGKPDSKPSMYSKL